jgi:hypothetical protein
MKIMEEPNAKSNPTIICGIPVKPKEFINLLQIAHANYTLK